MAAYAAGDLLGEGRWLLLLQGVVGVFSIRR